MNDHKKDFSLVPSQSPKNINRLCLVLACLFFISSCGSLNTVVRGDGVAAQKLTDKHTYCKTIPRVYSGVSYNFCSLHGEPAPYYSGQNSAGGFYFIFLDSILSGVFDTVVLPYTIIRQIDDGNILIKKPLY